MASLPNKGDGAGGRGLAWRRRNRRGRAWRAKDLAQSGRGGGRRRGRPVLGHCGIGEPAAVAEGARRGERQVFVDVVDGGGSAQADVLPGPGRRGRWASTAMVRVVEEGPVAVGEVRHQLPCEDRAFALGGEGARRRGRNRGSAMQMRLGDGLRPRWLRRRPSLHSMVQACAWSWRCAKLGARVGDVGRARGIAPPLALASGSQRRLKKPQPVRPSSRGHRSGRCRTARRRGPGR